MVLEMPTILEVEGEDLEVVQQLGRSENPTMMAVQVQSGPDAAVCVEKKDIIRRIAHTDNLAVFSCLSEEKVPHLHCCF